jgi:hypothetical protein
LENNSFQENAYRSIAASGEGWREDAIKSDFITLFNIFAYENFSD